MVQFIQGKIYKIRIRFWRKKGKDGWTTVDNYSRADIFWDLRNKIPLQDSTVDCIYSSHLLEHIAYMAGQHNYMFDEENLVNILQKVGFKGVKIRKFDSQIDNKERDYESIYAICYKEQLFLMKLKILNFYPKFVHKILVKKYQLRII